MDALKLKLLDEDLTIHRFDPDDKIPRIPDDNGFFTVVKTDEEVSVVCASDLELESWNKERDWSVIKVMGPLGFSLTGILSRIAKVLADAAISIFVISTFDTDYILIKSNMEDDAVSALQNAGYEFV